MKTLFKIISILMFAAAFGFADSTATATADSTVKATATDSSVATAESTSIQELKKKHAVWIKLEGDVEPSMYDFCARAIADALQENPDYISCGHTI